MMNDVTKLLSGVMSRLALQGDGPLRDAITPPEGYFLYSCQPLNRNPKGAPTIQQLTNPAPVTNVSKYSVFFLLFYAG
ncbi:hypothetical protein MOQ95_004924 [Salmonella enterica]|nr:hypothetical protein [Salmonella enterica]